LAKSTVEQAPPTRVNERNESDEPSITNFITEIELPARTNERTLTVEPNSTKLTTLKPATRAKVLTDIELPHIRPSITLIVPPKRALPVTERLLPARMKLLQLNTLPMCR
jgi:hypothetical protein